MAVERLLKDKLLLYTSQFRAVALTGARQSGKTTLCKMLFPKKPYINFENIDVLNQSQLDPKGFLLKYKETGAIFDEVQRVPILFNYLQEILDNEKEKGKYILTGSSNLLLNHSITQSLAGRVGFLEMNTFSLNEISNNSKISIWEIIFKGGYPEIWVEGILPQLYYPSYIQSFIEKDIRQLINVKNLFLYQQFIKLAATRSGQEWNNSSIAMELGIDSKTVSSWISYLQMAGIIYLLPPYFSNFGKRIIKRPKLYFTDTGVVCSLLSIQNEEQLENHPLKGQLFENFVIMELVKNNTYILNNNHFYYWRSIEGVEIDLIIEKNGNLIPVEIKSGMTYQPNWWKNIVKWNGYAKSKTGGVIIYTGNEEMNLQDGRQILNVANSSVLLN
jgi:predicted AAA+ superfamily ATPase